MTYLERLKEIEEKKETCLALYKAEIDELICDMARDIENLNDELRNYREEDWNKRAYGD